MKYFVTGATGFVGGALARQLRAAGHEVRASVRNPDQAKELEAIGVRLFTGDVTDKGSLREAMRGADRVFHVAGWYKIVERSRGQAEAVNVQGTRNVLELMRELKIPKGVYTSSMAANSDTKGRVVDESYRFTGKHLSEYDRTKAGAHDVAQEYIAQGLPLIIVMPGVIYGPGDTSVVRTMILQFLKGRLPMVPNRGGYCWAHVEDTVQGHILAMERGRAGETYMICGEPHHTADAIKLASQITGKRLPMTVPHQILQIASILAKPFDAFLPDLFTSEGLRVIAGVTYWGDNGKARRELGYAPRPFREGWEEILRHEMSLLDLS